MADASVDPIVSERVADRLRCGAAGTNKEAPMTHDHDQASDLDDVDAANELSRRAVLGMGVAAAAGGAAMVLGTTSGGVAADAGVSQILAATSPSLSYLGIDAYAFFDDLGDRLYQTLTGTQTSDNTLDRIWAPLGLPAGTILREIAVCYQGSPIVEISRRPFFDGVQATIPAQVFQQTFPDGPGGPNTTTRAINVTIDPSFTYTLSAFLSPGDSILGVRLGYLGGFVPFTGASPRILDTRVAGQGPALAVNVPRKVTLGLPGRAAILNVTAAEPTGRGNIAAYAGNIAFPGNSSVNFAGDRNTANLVIVSMDPTGAINLRAAFASTHVVVDRIGSFV
jgi:hypothetical protein